MDNNYGERQLRNPVVGRKNYYGSGSFWSAALTVRRFRCSRHFGYGTSIPGYGLQHIWRPVLGTDADPRLTLNASCPGTWTRSASAFSRIPNQQRMIHHELLLAVLWQRFQRIRDGDHSTSH